jgi:poly(hydroxyalkanoate) depolymerase family esterase
VFPKRERLLLVACCLGLTIVALVMAVSSNATDPKPDQARPALRTYGHGRVEQRTFPNKLRALVYIPGSLDPNKPAPLVVMLHGCSTSAESMEKATDFDREAERNRFVVMYPDGSGDQFARCWHFGTDLDRGSPDASAIAGMVYDAFDRNDPPIDRKRVYLTGMSSGASMAAVMGATHPDLFAAIAINAGCAYHAVHCGGHTPSVPSDQLAHEVVETMGSHARVVPVISLQGDQDKTVPGHSQQVVDQWRMTDNLVASGSLDSPISATPVSTNQMRPRGRYPSTVEHYDETRGCEVIQRWTIHGMGHFWPGGPRDPSVAGYTDPRAPRGAAIVWAFFRRYHLRANPCAPTARLNPASR